MIHFTNVLYAAMYVQIIIIMSIICVGGIHYVQQRKYNITITSDNVVDFDKEYVLCFNESSLLPKHKHISFVNPTNTTIVIRNEDCKYMHL